jgi:hypothetical protein
MKNIIKQLEEGCDELNNHRHIYRIVICCLDLIKSAIKFKLVVVWFLIKCIFRELKRIIKHE